MRKAHEKAIHLLRLGVTGKPTKNDEVTTVEEIDEAGFIESVKVWKYHGNIIARVLSNGELYVNWCGWYTQSTSERLYALCAYLGVARSEKKEGYIKVA